MRRALYTLLLAVLILFAGDLPQTSAGELPSVACATIIDGQTGEAESAGEPEAGAAAVAATAGRVRHAFGPAAAAPFSDSSPDSLDRPPA